MESQSKSNIMIYLLIFIAIGLLLIVSLIFLVIALLSKFTRVATGTEQFVVQGQKLVEVLDDNLSSSIWGLFGVRRIGFSFLGYDVKEFHVNPTKKNTDPNVKDDDPSTWTVPHPPRTVSHLRKRMERFIVAQNVELGGVEPVQVTAGFAIIFGSLPSVVTQNNNPEGGARFVFMFSADFDNPVSVLLTYIRTKISSKLTYQDLVQAPEDFFDSLLGDKNLEEDLKKFGLELLQIKMERLITDKSIEEASRKKLIAELELEAKKVEAEQTLVLGEAEAKVVALKAAAEIESRIKAFGRGLSAKEKADILVSLMQAEAIKEGKVTHLTLSGDKGVPTINLNNQNP